MNLQVWPFSMNVLTSQKASSFHRPWQTHTYFKDFNSWSISLLNLTRRLGHFITEHSLQIFNETKQLNKFLLKADLIVYFATIVKLSPYSHFLTILPQDIFALKLSSLAPWGSDKKRKNIIFYLTPPSKLFYSHSPSLPQQIQWNTTTEKSF